MALYIYYSMRFLKRVKLFLLILLIIAAGLLSRKVTALPAGTGDACYAMMMFFMIRFLLLHKTTRFIALLSLAVCFLIECSQLYQAPWIQAVRHTLPGRLILGQGFLWTDLIAYLIGVLLAAFVEKVSKTAP